MAFDRRVNSRSGQVRRPVMPVVALAVWGVVYGWPLVAIAQRSVAGVAGRAGLSWSSVHEVLTDGRIGRLALVSLAQTGVSVVVVSLIGVPLGWVLGRLDFGGRRLLAAAVMVPFVLPTLTVAGSMLAIVGGLPSSNVARFALIVGAHVCFNAGLMARSVAVAVAAVPPSVEEAARSLGRPPWWAAAATLGAVRASILGAAIVVAMFCMTSFGVIVALGGASLGTIEVEVWYLTTRSLDLASAAVLAATQFVVMALLVVCYQRFRPTAIGRVSFSVRQVSTRWERRVSWAAMITVGLVSGVPLGALVLRSFRGTNGWTVGHYAVLGGPGADAIAYSLAGAAVATAAALLIAASLVAAAARSDRVGRWFEGALVLPIAVSAATLGLGFLVAFSGPTLDLRGTWIVVPLVQAAGAAPVVARIVLSAVRSLDHDQLAAAAVLGAGQRRRLTTIVWPALRRPAGVAAGFAFAMAVGEYGATVFLSRANRPTVPVLIGRLLGRPGEANLGQALALSCVLGAIAALSVALVDRSTGDGPAW